MYAVMIRGMRWAMDAKWDREVCWTKGISRRTETIGCAGEEDCVGSEIERKKGKEERKEKI